MDAINNPGTRLAVTARFAVALSFIMLLVGCQQTPQHEYTALVMERRVAFPEVDFADKKLVEQCDITTRLAEDIRYYAKPHFSRIDLVDSVSAGMPGKVLSVTIVKLGKRGRSLIVKGELHERGVAIGNFVTQDTFHRSASACMALTGMSRVLSRRISKWLAAPTLNARLGPI